MLKLNPEPQFTADVEITVPGKEDAEAISITFIYRGKKEYAEFLEKCKNMPDVDYVMAIATSWSGMEGEFNKKDIALFLNNYPSAARDIARAYFSLLMESRVKY